MGLTTSQKQLQGPNFETIADFLQWWMRNELLTGEERDVFRAYYAGYYRLFGSNIRRHFADQVSEIMVLLHKAKTPPRILEVGCGCGTESLWFALHGAEVVGVDIRDDRLQTARVRAAILQEIIGASVKVQFANASLFDLETDASYDIIWMEQAFHHLEPRSAVYCKIAGLLRDGGWLVISETNALNPLIQIMLLNKRRFATIGSYINSQGRVLKYGNERITTAKRLVTGFASEGLTKISVRYFRTLPNHPLSEKLSFIEKWVPDLALPLFTHYNYVGRKTMQRKSV